MIELRDFTSVRADIYHGLMTPADRIFLDRHVRRLIHDPVIRLPGYEIHPFRIEGMESKADGCVFVIPPHNSTRTQHITGDVVFTDAWENGSGMFLGVNPNGKVTGISISESNATGMIKYTKGWTLTWIAGSRELRVMSINRPAFKPDMETEVRMDSTEVNGVVIPREYWERYHTLRSSP